MYSPNSSTSSSSDTTFQNRHALSIDEMLSLPIGNNDSILTNSPRQQPQQQQQQQITYRKVRAEPINEKSLVGSVVGFLHDVVGGGGGNGSNCGESKHSSLPTKRHNIVQSGTSTLLSNLTTTTTPGAEIKEQIEWLHFEPITLLDSSKTSKINNANLVLMIGYKTGFSVWCIDLNGVCTEALLIREPNITHAKLVQIESVNKVLIAVCKLMSGESSGSNEPVEVQNITTTTTTTTAISVINLANGECLHEILFNGAVLEMKSNGSLLCVSSPGRIDAFELNSFEHRFSLDSCYPEVSKSTGRESNAFALGHRWLAFADNKFHVMLNSQGGVCTDIEQSYTATMLNTAKSISKGLVKISESVVNSMVSKSKVSSMNHTGSGVNGHSPHLTKKRHDSKEDHRPGVCTVLDTRKYLNNARKPQSLHGEEQTWIVAHFMAHQDQPISALEFNQNGRLLVSADSLGQYFNVFQLNANAYKSTRTVVKHLYSLYRGDTTAKVRNICFAGDSRWLAISTKRGTTHIFPLNPYGGPVNARTHSKPHVVNRSTKHQRTAGFTDADDMPYFPKTVSPISSSDPQLHQQFQMQQMIQQHYDNSHSLPLLVNNNPKLKTLMEPFVIPAYAQLKQPNANSSFHSSVLSSSHTSACAATSSSSAAQSASSSNAPHLNPNGLNSSAPHSFSVLAGSSTLAASALSSAALVTENVTNFASNTTNMIQYDNVCIAAFFAESRGYLSPEEPRDYGRLKPVNSLFAISDVNGSLVEFVLDVTIDTSKGSRPTNDSPIQLRITPKAQWPLQRFVSSDELKYPVKPDNPLLFANQPSLSAQSNHLRKQNSLNIDPFISFSPNNSLISNSPSSFFSTHASFQPPSLNPATNNNNNEWIKLIETNTHIGPHRRLFMGPQFVFKTFNSNITTTKLTASSSSVISDVETPIIDLAGDIELNTLDTRNNFSVSPSPRRLPSPTPTLFRLNSGIDVKSKGFFHYTSTSPMQINPSAKMRFDATPTYIEIGSGSYQDMPILSGFMNSMPSHQKIVTGQSDSLGDNIIDSIADAMSDLNMPSGGNVKDSQKNHRNIQKAYFNSTTPAIAINNGKVASKIVGATPSSSAGSYFFINPTLSGASDTNGNPNTPSACSSSSSSSSGRSSCGNNANNSHDDDSASSNSSSTHCSLSLTRRTHPDSIETDENMQFHDDVNLLH